MKKKFHTKDGIIERELTNSEMENLYNLDDDVRRELDKKAIEKSSSIDEKINIILKHLKLI